jgi:hypothetical protein
MPESGLEAGTKEAQALTLCKEYMLTRSKRVGFLFGSIVEVANSRIVNVDARPIGRSADYQECGFPCKLVSNYRMEPPPSQYLHIAYLPEVGWVLSIMSRLLNSHDPRLRNAFEQWSQTPLQNLGFAITTRMHMLGRSILRLNARVSELRNEISSNIKEIEICLLKGSAYMPKDRELPFELLIDMDSFIFETRSLYEIMGKFLVALFDLLFDRKITEAELQSVLSAHNIDTRWITELRENRKLFFHETAPWLAVEIQMPEVKADPVLLKKPACSFKGPDDFVRFASLRGVYEGFINSITTLHQFVMEQIRIRESADSKTT